MDVNFLDIISDYEKLVKTQVRIPMNTGDIINFEFKPSHLPHLLGLNKLLDIPVLLDYSNKKRSAYEIYMGIKNGDIDSEEFKKSKYYPEIFKDKIAYFSSERIMNLINSTSIIKFDPSKIKDFETKLEKVDYLFYEIISATENGYVHFGIAFTTKDDINHPNTFFARENDDYIRKQISAYPYSLYIRDKYKKVTFKIYWGNVRKCMNQIKNTHYKALNKLAGKYGYDVDALKQADIEKLLEIETEENGQELRAIEKHLRLLRLDEVKAVYSSYIENTQLWNNQQKQYLISKIDESHKDYLPSEIKSLLNEFHPTANNT
jgi:hypothetical protein